MIPFYEIIQWWRRATAGERSGAGVAVAVVLALIAWIVVPTGGSSGSSASAAASSNGSGKCTNPDGAVTGVTAQTIKVGIILVNVSGIANNSSLGIAPYAEQKAEYSAVVKAVNAAGGVDCRTIDPVFINGNPADQASLQQTCLDAVQAGVFAVLDAGAFAQFPIVQCFPQHKLPYFGGYVLPQQELAKFYPYLFQFNNSDSLYKTTITALDARGFFSATTGFQKLGLIYQDCNPQHYTEVRALLAQYNVPDSSIVPYDVGCPEAFTPGSVLEQAVLKFKQAGVTNVVTIGFRGDFPTFTKLAAVQHFAPKYGLPDDQVVFATYGTSAPDLGNLSGAIAVSENRDGEEKTPGYVPSAGTVACNKIITAIGQKPVYQAVAGGGGNACNEVWEFKAAVDHESSLSQTLLPEGLQAAKSVDFSFPQGPNDYSAPRTTWGGEYYRVVQFEDSCKCWQLLTKTFVKSDP